VFILYGLLAGLIAGFALGGRLENLAGVRFRFGPLAIVALAIQLPSSRRSRTASPTTSRAPPTGLDRARRRRRARELRLAGVPLIAIGRPSTSSRSSRTAADAGQPGGARRPRLRVDGNTNSVVVADPALAALTDVFAMPARLRWRTSSASATC
jgi:hypothetical protein